MTESRRSTLLGTIESTPPSTRHSDQDNPSSFPLVLQSIPLPPRWACVLVACPCRSHPSTAPAVPQPFAVSPWHCSSQRRLPQVSSAHIRVVIVPRRHLSSCSDVASLRAAAQASGEPGAPVYHQTRCANSRFSPSRAAAAS